MHELCGFAGFAGLFSLDPAKNRRKFHSSEQNDSIVENLWKSLQQNER